MRNKIKIQAYITGIALLLGLLPAFSQQTDSLAWYLEIAARNNPLVNSNFALYKASLEKIPQAGAYEDPELDIGVFVKPMETLSGKQIADFTLMQMFPWFGTRKAARNEATEMSRMAYEQFREARNNLFYEVKSQWYQLCNLNEQYKNTQANLALLEQLEKLALNRYSAPSANAPASTITPITGNAVTPPASNGSSMDNMGGMGSGTQAAPQGSPAGNSSMQEMASGPMGSSMGTGSSSGTMSDVLRIQIEKAELQNNLELIVSNRTAAEARFNALLNRRQDMRVAVPDSLRQLHFLIDDQAMTDSIIIANPMLSMLEAEANAYRAKAEMDKKMSYPMFGIGLQYSLVGKSNNSMVMDNMNGMDMVMPMFKISIPIFRKKYQAQQKESRHYRQASELKYENTLNQLQSEYQTVKQQLADASRKIALYQKQQELSLSTWQLIVREFSAGTTSLTDVIQVERQLLDYRLKKSEAIAEYNTRIAGMEKLVATSINE
ncbi:TolC family protein [Parabacteroides goldsteinii]|uniref:TolC family protein n=1 Tax=Parabacteroides goldsteinii TaxID=328812 RepID=UPI001CC9224E|nr:TolC family protein [Parabacteroides goldsteinii]UBD76161.1 TolC family protein [Parabacteroides goldsteinii]